MFDLNKELVLHGIGKGYLNTVTDKFLEILHGQGLKIDIKSTLTDVEGGDSLFPIYTFISKKEGSIEIDSATFSLSQVGIAQTVEYKTTNVKRNLRVLKTKSDTSIGENLTGVSDVKCFSPSGERVTVIQTGDAPGESEVLVKDTGELSYGASLAAGEYTFWCKVDSTNAAEAVMLKDAMPEIASFTWMFKPGDMDGGEYQIDIFAKRVRADGGFNMDLGRDKATVPKLTLKILDPGDGSSEFAKIVVSKIA